MTESGISFADFVDRLASLEREAVPAIVGATTTDELEQLRIRYLGRNAGWLSTLSVTLGQLAASDRPHAGKQFNEIRQRLQAALDDRVATVRSATAQQVGADLTMPGRATWRGARHPVTVVIDEIADIFRELGFTIALGPEADSEWYNFTALNFPPDHPAVDLHDTLYLESGALLRTHTSPVQIRTLQRYMPPIRVLVPGNVYRRDFFDASHAPMFAQIEGLAVDEGVSFVDLKATLSHFATRFFGATATRFRPSFFPFTEPSAEMDVECQICKGAGCRTCKGTGWSEIMGCGMVHPSVIQAAGLDAERYTGWAFGMGPARVAQQRYDIPDIRTLYDADVRVLGALAQ
jgi:phenylalanyl-tRNA synthetase alpha chain